MNTKKQGFTLIELLIVIIISSVIFAVLSPLLRAGFNSFFAQKAYADADAQGRLAMERMSRDIRGIPSSGNISTASASQLTFTDSNNNSVNYYLSGTSLMLGSNILADGINSLTFNYYDQNGATTATIANIRYIKVTLNITQNNTNTMLMTVINPRNITS